MDEGFYFLRWMMLLLALSPIWGALLIEIWLLLILPNLRPISEIHKEAARFLVRFPNDPIERVDFEIHAAWMCSDSFAVGKLFRVKCLIKKHRKN